MCLVYCQWTNHKYFQNPCLVVFQFLWHLYWYMRHESSAFRNRFDFTASGLSLTYTRNKNGPKSSSVVGHTVNGLPTPSLGMDTPISGILAYWVIISCRMHWEWLTHPITWNGYTYFRHLNILNHHQLQDTLRMAYTHPITENGYTHLRPFNTLIHHQLQDVLRMAYPPHRWEWVMT